MQKRSNEKIEHHDCPEDVQDRLTLAGGTNWLGEPNFKVVWGYNRIVKMHGEWQEIEPARLLDVFELEGGQLRQMVIPPRIKSSVVETREVPKYLPGNCWHLERWCPPEMYGSPEHWGKLGQEVVGNMTIDTAGPFPSRGEYELVMPLTADGTVSGQRMELSATVVELIVGLLLKSQDFRPSQRRAAIMQREARKEEQYVERAKDILREGLPAFHGNQFIIVPKGN